MRATYSPSTRGMHHISLRQGLRPFSASRRRTVSPDRLSCPVSLTMASASSSSVQRARPLGGFAQAVATSKASSPPKGRARWTLELLADAMVKLTGHESLSGETVRRRLAENGLKPWRRDIWCIPRVDGEYVARMEDVLDLYAE